MRSLRSFTGSFEDISLAQKYRAKFNSVVFFIPSIYSLNEIYIFFTSVFSLPILFCLFFSCLLVSLCMSFSSIFLCTTSTLFSPPVSFFVCLILSFLAVFYFLFLSVFCYISVTLLFFFSRVFLLFLFLFSCLIFFLLFVFLTLFIVLFIYLVLNLDLNYCNFPLLFIVSINLCYILPFFVTAFFIKCNLVSFLIFQHMLGVAF